MLNFLNIYKVCGVKERGNIYGYIMDHNYDIDTKEDFALADSILNNKLYKEII